jgi:anti-sigma B factor antagonist
MHFKIQNRRIEDVVLLDLSGKLTIGEPVTLLRDMMHAYFADEHKKFVINLGDVSYIDSSGLGELVWAHVSVKKIGGDVKLLNVTSRVKDLMQITKLVSVFDTYEDESSALAALKG